MATVRQIDNDNKTKLKDDDNMEIMSRFPQSIITKVDLLGVPIIALEIDGQERLCLAQISNTLLKQYNYNEVHNRRVALGINCVQCTPVQLEILRRAGAMPDSSRRCGMITKKEAERLCKSFLAHCPPPKLSDDFFFSVTHKCAWGCRGSFIPSRYNSSRAKCIQCAHCRLFFSPNKFIFHSHRFPDSTYTQPDAANFNNWRRHLVLVRKENADDGTDDANEELGNLWEEVKAMFNGSRKRFVMAQRTPVDQVKKTNRSPAPSALYHDGLGATGEPKPIVGTDYSTVRTSDVIASSNPSEIGRGSNFVSNCDVNMSSTSSLLLDHYASTANLIGGQASIIPRLAALPSFPFWPPPFYGPSTPTPSFNFFPSTSLVGLGSPLSSLFLSIDTLTHPSTYANRAVAEGHLSHNPATVGSIFPSLGENHSAQYRTCCSGGIVQESARKGEGLEDAKDTLQAVAQSFNTFKN